MVTGDYWTSRHRRSGEHAAGGWRAIAIWCGCGLAALALWAAYARLSQTFPANSDGAVNALQAWQMLHGNPLLRAGWVLSRRVVLHHQLPEYMLVELATGLTANVIHVAAGMTYALALVAAAALATGRARGWAAVIGGCIAAGSCSTRRAATASRCCCRRRTTSAPRCR